MSYLDIILTVIACVCSVSCAVVAIINSNRSSKHDDRDSAAAMAQIRESLDHIEKDIAEIKAAKLDTRISILENKVENLYNGGQNK
jgi:hypothetical protein